MDRPYGTFKNGDYLEAATLVSSYLIFQLNSKEKNVEVVAFAH
jgi:hypothetical protein